MITPANLIKASNAIVVNLTGEGEINIARKVFWQEAK